MIVRFPLLRLLLIVQLVALSGWAAEPTELREWTAKGGFKVEAKAMRIQGNQVQLARADGTQLTVDLQKFTDEDQALLRSHFDVSNDPSETAVVGEPASDLPHALGQTTDELECGNSHYFMYLPKSLQQGEKHPIIFVMNPGGGGASTVGSYQQGAERNRWIIAVSKESKNGFEGSLDAVSEMIETVYRELPIDEKRMYVSGFSGGSRIAYLASAKHKKIAGVLSCGAGGSLGTSKQVAYGLCGTNCFNRTDMASSFKGVRNKESILRYFPGMHVWAGAELLDDAITHLNGVFLVDHQRDYSAQLSAYLQEVTGLVDELKENDPMRAFMWTSFLTERGVLPSSLTAIHNSLVACKSLHGE